MAEPVKNSEESIAKLVEDIATDTRHLVRQEIELAKVELGRALDDAKMAGLFFAMGGSVLLVALILFGVGIALTIATSGFPLWAAFLVLSGFFASVGAFVAYKGISTVEAVRLFPRRTVGSVKENVSWIRSRV